MLYDPIDMDGVPWTEDLSNCIQDLAITFSGEGLANTTDLNPGETALVNFIITEEEECSFTVNAIHPVTGELYTMDVQYSGRATSYPSKYYAAISVVCGSEPIKLAKVMVLPTAVSFLSLIKEEPANILIPTNSPLVSTILMNTVTVEIDNNLARYNYREIDETGLLRINGVSPIQGNIDILGVGQTAVRVSSATKSDMNHG